MKVKVDKGYNFDSNFIKMKPYLHRDFWDEKVLLPEIEETLLKIAKDVYDSMDLGVPYDDITITGSIASLSWHKDSDIDLHILIDFSKISNDFELVKRALDQSRINWNKTHDIFIRGHEVEIYFQDTNETHESDGVWSLTKKTWVKEPNQMESFYDLYTTEKKAEMIAKTIDHAEQLFEEGKYEEAYNLSNKVKKKVSRMRKAGLEEEGIYSPENLAFKMLRNSKYLEKLSNLKISSYDKKMSLNEAYIKDYFIEKDSNMDSDYLEYGDGGGIESLLDLEADAPWGDTEKQDA